MNTRLNYAPIDHPPMLLQDKSYTKQRVSRVLDRSQNIEHLLNEFLDNTSLKNIVANIVEVRGSIDTRCTGFRIDSQSILIPGHAVRTTSMLITENGKTNQKLILKNFYPEIDMALVASNGRCNDFEYYGGGTFGQQDYLLFFYDGKLKFKPVETCNGQILNETMKGLSGGIVISIDPYLDFKITGFHVGGGHILQAKDIQIALEQPIIGPSLNISESEICEVGGYPEEAKFTNEGYTVIEYDHQGKVSERNGEVYVKDDSYSYVIKFISDANSEENKDKYHKNVKKFYLQIGEKAREEVANQDKVEGDTFKFKVFKNMIPVSCTITSKRPIKTKNESKKKNQQKPINKKNLKK